MLRKIGQMAAIIVLLFTQKVFAGNTPIEVGLTFHYFTSAPPTPTLYNFICDLNDLYNSQNDAKIHFYLNDVIETLVSIPDDGAAVHASPPKGMIDLYQAGTTSGWGNGVNSTYWVIMYPTITALPQMAHEIGHLLGLQHPNGGKQLIAICACDPVSGSTEGPDCISDTNPPYNLTNIMEEGALSATDFTQGQEDRMHWCTNQRGWLPRASTQALHDNYSNFIPLEHLDPSSGFIYWDYPLDCVVMPNMVEVIVTTKCPNGTLEHIQTYTRPNITMPLTISTIRGIFSIKYIYHYPGTPYTNFVFRDYSSSGYNGDPYLGYCTIPGGGGGSSKTTSVEEITANGNIFHIANTAATSSLEINNTGFRQYNIYDISGRKMLSGNISNGISSIDISTLPAGMYIIKAKSGNEEVNERFSKI